jgi:ATP-dependent protease HslVU (ClpYQ) peptidase subunit
MTTIAISKTAIAADGLRTWGDQVRGTSFHKILRVEKDGEKTIYAMSGMAPMFLPLVQWHSMNNADPDKVPKGDGDWSLIVLTKPGMVVKYSSLCPYPEVFEAPIAFGAGGDYAMGAMMAGASASAAVEIVARLCNHTGGNITTIDLEKEFPPAETTPEAVPEAAE